MDQLNELLRISISKLRREKELLDHAEYDGLGQIEALKAIDFLPEYRANIHKSLERYAKIEYYIAPLYAIFTTVVAFILMTMWESWREALALAQVMLLGYAFLTGYNQWIRAECNRNVDDATKIKDKINDVIKNNIQLLYPYVGSAFGTEINYLPDPVEFPSRRIIDMYVFSELDNLEFVYEKAKFGLIFPEYAFRTIKIFISRAENERFAQRSSQLVIEGRYNIDFQRLVKELIYIGLYRREESMSLKTPIS